MPKAKKSTISEMNESELREAITKAQVAYTKLTIENFSNAPKDTNVLIKKRKEIASLKGTLAAKLKQVS